MLKQFSIDYVMLPRQNNRRLTHLTDDPVEAEEFLMHLLMAGARIGEIRHEGKPLSGHQFDRMIRVAAERVASLMLQKSLGADAGQAKDRFGFAA